MSHRDVGPPAQDALTRSLSQGFVLDRPGEEWVSKRTIVAVYRQARKQAQLMGTLRLRWRARRIQRSTDWDDQHDLARLAALRDELRDRGVEVGPL